MSNEDGGVGGSKQSSNPFSFFLVEFVVAQINRIEPDVVQPHGQFGEQIIPQIQVVEALNTSLQSGNGCDTVVTEHE